MLQVRDGVLQALLWQRAQEPSAGAWALPGGYLEPGETLEESIRRHLAAKVDVQSSPHLEQLGTWSNPARHPSEWQLATAYVGLVPRDVDPEVPADTAWHPVESLPPMAFDHGELVLAGRERLRAKLSYTNVGFALAPPTFTISELRELYTAALGHEVSATNLQRVLVRRALLEDTASAARPARTADGRRRSSASARASSRSPTSSRCCDHPRDETHHPRRRRSCSRSPPARAARGRSGRSVAVRADRQRAGAVGLLRALFLLDDIDRSGNPAKELPRIDAARPRQLADRACHALMHEVGRRYGAEHKHTLGRLMDVIPQSNDPTCSAGFGMGLVMYLGRSISSSPRQERARAMPAPADAVSHRTRACTGSATR